LARRCMNQHLICDVDGAPMIDGIITAPLL
jgi:hypothetical protein